MYVKEELVFDKATELDTKIWVTSTSSMMQKSQFKNPNDSRRPLHFFFPVLKDDTLKQSKNLSRLRQVKLVYGTLHIVFERTCGLPKPLENHSLGERWLYEGVYATQ